MIIIIKNYFSGVQGPGFSCFLELKMNYLNKL